MLIINADDWGMNKLSTNNTLSCYQNKRITSVSAMTFMADSERSSKLALENDLDVGLHLNFTMPFDDYCVSSRKLKQYHSQIAKFLLKRKYCPSIYNPTLKCAVEYVYKAQRDEFLRLYRKPPTHIDGHHHMHLCMNMIINNIIEKRTKVRRSLFFFPNEKTFFNRLYRCIIDKRLVRRYICVDFLFDILPFQSERIRNIVNLSKSKNVELKVHPERDQEYKYLMNDKFLQTISDVKFGSYKDL